MWYFINVDFDKRSIMTAL